MKWVYAFFSLAILMVTVFLAGCTDEVVDPELDYQIVEVFTNVSSPNPNGVIAPEGKHFVWVKIKMENQNENTDLTITPGAFSADDNTTEVKGKYMANQTFRRKIDSIAIDPKTTKDLWVIFQVNDGSKLLYIRYKGTLDEPIEKQMPVY